MNIRWKTLDHFMQEVRQQQRIDFTEPCGLLLLPKKFLTESNDGCVNRLYAQYGRNHDDSIMRPISLGAEIFHHQGDTAP